MIRLLYFARLRERLGVAEDALETDPELRAVADVMRVLALRGGVWAEVFTPGPGLLCAVNQVMARPETAVRDGDEVGFFPPVTGG
jgi:molybdopterin synthase sulfur carrier subunit